MYQTCHVICNRLIPLLLQHTSTLYVFHTLSPQAQTHWTLTSKNRERVVLCLRVRDTHTHSLLHCSSGLTQACFADIHLITVRDLFIYECWYCTFLCFYFLTSFKLLKELLC